MPRRQKISDDEIRAAAKAGMTAVMTAKKYGVSETTISRRAAVLEVQFVPSSHGPASLDEGLTPEQRADVERLVVVMGYSKRAARDLVLRPRVKVRAVQRPAVAEPVRAAVPVRSASAARLSTSSAAIERWLAKRSQERRAVS